MASPRLILLAVLFVACLLSCSAQLTFTPGWGKRSTNNMFGNSAGMNNRALGCKSSTESLLAIFHFIEAEAQKFLDCNQK
ncbi:unnamed protein product [Hermetia illucens]|uniref:Adipokinetic hormone 1 n=1 Tax=Hermetia illucens TaxID=343691 RepID=A0A7R8UNT5_HERIL|nr:adipokinetic hormone [Hermetia illucens]CAD7083362.1 unnamed protein product [Hermetia illucens]